MQKRRTLKDMLFRRGQSDAGEAGQLATMEIHLQPMLLQIEVGYLLTCEARAEDLSEFNALSESGLLGPGRSLPGTPNCRFARRLVRKALARRLLQSFFEFFHEALKPSFLTQDGKTS